MIYVQKLLFNSRRNPSSVFFWEWAMSSFPVQVWGYVWRCCKFGGNELLIFNNEKKRDKWQKIKIKCVCVWLISITKPRTTLVGFHDIDWTSQTTREKQNKNRKKKCIMRRKRKQYRLRFDWKSLENCLHFINTVLNTIKWLRSQLWRSKRFYFSLFHYIIIHL